MKELLIGYLTFVNEKNTNERYDTFKKSLKSLERLTSDNIDFISIDNNSTSIVKHDIYESKMFKECFHSKTNFYDIALLYFTCKYAVNHNYKYFLYTYDDFTVNDNYNNDLGSCIDFMNKYDVDCVRVTDYKKDDRYYDTLYTSKDINPDSIRHYNTVTRQQLNWVGPYTSANHVFYINNWHYTSRPTIWKTETFKKIFDDLEEIPIMQGFEKIATIFFNDKIKHGVLDNGFLKTVKQSERMNIISKQYDIKVKKGTMDNFYNNVGENRCLKR